jgi:hypothetical protein
MNGYPNSFESNLLGDADGVAHVSVQGPGIVDVALTGGKRYSVYDVIQKAENQVNGKLAKGRPKVDYDPARFLVSLDGDDIAPGNERKVYVVDGQTVYLIQKEAGARGKIC